MANKKEIIKKKKGEVIKEAQISKKGENQEIPSKRAAGVIMILMTMVLLLILLLFLHWNLDSGELGSSEKTRKDFKEEYERLNGEKDEKGNSYQTLLIEEDNIVQYASYNRIFSLLERGTGVIYFGSPESVGCRAVLPVLLDAADEVGIDTIYYLNVSEEREKTEGTKDYQKLVETINNQLEKKEGKEKIKELYFPTLLFVKEGELVSSYIGTQIFEEEKIELTEEEKEELKTELMKKMNQVITCDDAC